MRLTIMVICFTKNYRSHRIIVICILINKLFFDKNTFMKASSYNIGLDRSKSLYLEQGPLNQLLVVLL